ncbi:serine/threonine protein kinase [Oscillatoriales cyanobacterium LEGE 11467]|uniref:non-specific serine/threonine protein kinase n=1 Tax=Zarconia navalis LEGE 11467 TaxID=1828826 RepID=A0A928Z8R8_9CYAN|nr:serine/threonine-protein kinase [Zarconia navalis]MBE9040958.1 serine/threonine protein kinase [Zarconia navalis LEGE 11467]
MKNLIYPEMIVADHYRIVTKIGQGAFGTTYEAEDLTNYKRVAIKVLSLRQVQDWKVLDLFEREAKVLARIDHRAIPKYLDYFHEATTDDRRFYLVQELVSGESLSTLVKKGWHGSEDQVRDIALQVLQILDDLHQMQPSIIHRDIKPSNIIRRADGQIYLVDFGAVKDVYRQTLMGGETFIGTLGYMPPEQFRGQSFFASDLYALGATLLFLLTHRSPEELPRKRMRFDFRNRVNISPEFANWLDKILEPAVEDRFKSAKEAANALQGKVNLADSTASYEKFGSVIFKKNARHFVCKTSCNWFTILIFLALSLGFLFTILHIVAALLFGAFFCLISFCMACEKSLKIDEDYLNISIKFPSITISRIQLQRDNISLIHVEETRNSEGDKVLHLVIQAGVKKYSFGTFLNKAEKEWLAAKISDFLGLKPSKSAIQAIEVLQHDKNVEKVDRSSSPVEKAPSKGTSVILNRSQNRLFLDLPTNTNSKIGVGCLTFLFVFSIFPFSVSWILNSFSDFHAYLILLSIPILSFLISSFLIGLTSQELSRIEIGNRHYYCLYDRPLGPVKISGKTVDIQGCRLQMTNDSQNAKCLLTIDNKDYELGLLLTVVEKQWLVEEVSDFLKMLKSRRDEKKLSG